MNLTRTKLAKMKEAEFQQSVLLPLFQKMGYRDVHLYQGSTELGKDIIMWKPGDLGERVNYVVVAKAKKVTGKATGNSSAANVYFQVTQAFTSTWLDPTTTEECRADRCFVVCSKEINNEALNNIKGALSSHYFDRMTKFIDGDTLWRDYIQKYLPEKTVIENLSQLQGVLENLNPYYKVVANTEGEFQIVPKYPGAEKDHPLIVPATLVFPKTEEGEKAREEFEHHLATGDPVTISGDYFEQLPVPEFVREMFGAPAGNLKITLVPLKADRPLLARLILESDDGERAEMEYIHFEGAGGHARVTLDNEQQPVPWKFELTMYLDERRFALEYRIDRTALNVFQGLQAFRFMRAMSKGGKFSLQDLRTGWVVPFTEIHPGVFPKPDDIWIEVLEKLIFIQEKTQTLINIPDSAVNSIEFDHIFWVAEVIETGIATLYNANGFTSAADLNLARNLLEYFGDGEPHGLLYEPELEQTVTIFGTEIPLGKASFSSEMTYIAQEDLNILKKAVEEGVNDAPISFKMRFVEGYPLRGRYHKWVPRGQESASPPQGQAIED